MTLELDASGWKLVYDVSAGYDYNDCPWQRNNPFYGDCMAPAAWLNMNYTEGVLCALIPENKYCIFVVEYDKEYGYILERLAAEMDECTVETGVLRPHGLRIDDFSNKFKCTYTSLRFPKFDPPKKGCCDVHEIIRRNGKLKPYLQQSRIASSGHMSFTELMRYEPEWDFVVTPGSAASSSLSQALAL